MTDDGGFAFPSHGSMGEVVCEGMLLRDWFAGMALQGLLASGVSKDVPRALRRDIADRAYLYADAMLFAKGVKK